MNNPDKYYDGLQSSVITFLRLPLAMLVVMIHNYASLISSDYSGSFSGGLFDSFHILFAQGICRIAVPAFFVFSGYLYFSKLSSWSTKIFLDKERKRVKSLLVPYILWNVLALCVVVAVKYFKSAAGIEPFTFSSFWENNGGFRFLWDNNQHSFDRPINILGVAMQNCFPFNGPLWFIRDLFVVTLLSPIIYFLIKKGGSVFISIVSVLMIFDIWIPATGFSSLAFAFFSWGGFLKLKEKNLVLFCRSFEMESYVLACISLTCTLLTYNHNMVLYAIMQRILALIGTAAIINLASRIIEEWDIVPSKTLSNSSFIVFAAQRVYLIPFAVYLTKMILPFNGQLIEILQYLISSAIVVLICVAAYYVMRKFMPKTLGVLTGGR